MVGRAAAAADKIQQLVITVADRARLDLLGDVARQAGAWKIRRITLTPATTVSRSRALAR
jgi:hypothetical protein